LSEEAPYGLRVVQKIFGIVLLAIGILTTYNTYTNMSAAQLGAGFFVVMGIALIVLGFILIVARLSTAKV